MHLQKLRFLSALHLPSTRQRNDGFHENHFEINVSTLIFPMQHSKTPLETLRKIAAIAVTFAIFTAPQVFDLQSAQAKPSSKPVGTWGRTTGSATYVRVRPGTQTPIVAKVTRGTQLMVWGTFNGWYRVETTDHKFGWIYHDLVNVPRAEKLKELSHAKAIAASNRSGNQTLYGDAEVLKKYYAKHKAPGAKVGLEKQGVSLAKAKPAPKAMPVVVRPQSKPFVVKTTSTPNAPRHVTITTAEPEIAQAKVIEVRADEAVVTSSEKAPVSIVRSTPRGTELASRKSTSRPERTVVKVPPEKITIEPMSPSKLPQITAADIMNARRAHMQNQLASRHKTRPGVVKSSPNSTVKTAPAVKAKVQPSSDDDEIIGDTYVLDLAKKAPARGGSPRDYAKYAAQNGKLGRSMANQALSYRGMPYISGASSPNRGFDCSGLIYYLLRSRGYNPPRTAAGFASYGTPVAKKNLKPGDLVLFANTYKRGVSHIGIYTGNNKFVHAANRRSGVKTDSLSSAYYSKKYYGARRVPGKK